MQPEEIDENNSSGSGREERKRNGKTMQEVLEFRERGTKDLGKRTETHIHNVILELTFLGDRIME